MTPPDTRDDGPGTALAPGSRRRTKTQPAKAEAALASVTPRAVRAGQLAVVSAAGEAS